MGLICFHPSPAHERCLLMNTSPFQMSSQRSLPSRLSREVWGLGYKPLPQAPREVTTHSLLYLRKIRKACQSCFPRTWALGQTDVLGVKRSFQKAFLLPAWGRANRAGTFKTSFWPRRLKPQLCFNFVFLLSLL